MATAGYIEFEPVNARSFNYNLTPAGESLRQGLFDQYCVEMVQGYTTLKQMIRNKLAPLRRRGLLRVALFGASETCEVVVSSLRNTDFRIVALLDSDPAKQGMTFLGMVISPPMVLASLNCQVVVITSFSRQEEIGRQIDCECSSRNLEIVRL